MMARVIACILIIANHMAFYSAELYRWIWAEFLAARPPFFLLAAGYFVGRGSFGPLDGGSFFLWKRSWFLLRPYLGWGLAAAVLIGWSPLHEYYASYQPMYAWLKGEAGSGFWSCLLYTSGILSSRETAFVDLERMEAGFSVEKVISVTPEWLSLWPVSYTHLDGIYLIFRFFPSSPVPVFP